MGGPINPNCYSKGGRFNSRKSNTDDYETPAWAVAALIKGLYDNMGILLTTHDKVIDPVCGRMAMVAEAQRYVNLSSYHGSPCNFIGSDIRDIPKCGMDHYGGVDFFQKDLFELTKEDLKGANIAILNPPFTFADDMVLSLKDLGLELICVLQRSQYMEGIQRYNALFKEHPEAAVMHFCNRVSMEVEGDARVHSKGMMTFSWYVWLNVKTPFTKLYRLPAEADFTHDRRLVAVCPDGKIIEVRDLLDPELFPKEYMYFKQTCGFCDYPIMRMKKFLRKENDFSCPQCKKHSGLYRPTATKERNSFNTEFRIV